MRWPWNSPAVSNFDRRVLAAAVAVIPLFLLLVLAPMLAAVTAIAGLIYGAAWLIRWGLRMDQREREVHALEQKYKERYK